jgi:hypothetical protein
VVVADDSVPVRERIAALLGATVEELHRAVDEHEPDVAVIDERARGRAAARRHQHRPSGVRQLVHGAEGQPDVPRRGRRHGFSLVAVVAGVGAAVLPARRASRLNVLEAVAYE